ncbi:toxin-antitoxin system YwqK family antitoxin [Acinetobacter lanii]|uniref:Toxin-antitoxin system YwqK family antitoxin n=1 Tax=Acinetobacter lanii TaxID=2715163 RepID=A0A6G8S0X2_9GAMM|nr:toxin-antitoxin system YwqK family antitoxin [Acinetobacter lanii]QIO07740.1 toxin-antitoxin system YwqK family antitoxin [Acinetobacter lanii]
MINKSLFLTLTFACLAPAVQTHAEGYINENMVVFVSEEDPAQSPWKEKPQCNAVSKSISKGLYENQYTFQNGNPLTSVFLSKTKIKSGECENLVQFPDNIQGTGVFESFYPNGKTHSRIEYQDGQYEGKLQFWFANGLKQQESQIINGMNDGDYKIWHPNGQIAMSSKYKQDIPVGMRQRWYESGDPWTYVRFDNGRMVGELKQWYRNGKLERQGQYKNGVREGVYKSWYESGKPEAELAYSHGNIKAAQCWNTSGVLKTEKSCIQSFADEQ